MVVDDMINVIKIEVLKMQRLWFISGSMLCLLAFSCLPVWAQVWQWSVPVNAVISSETNDHPQAFLWIPERCKRVRAVVVGQHNMVEEGIFEHTLFRKTMSELDFAVVWVSPHFSITFDFTQGAGDQFNAMMQALADSSGYSELASVPVVPMGHSALASFPWNFAAWDPGRTLAAISVHGDAPLTRLTGSGKPNPDWGTRTIEGVPGLFIMGEYEWWEDRIAPGFDYVAKNPGTPLTLFADAGHGHFDYSEELIAYVCLFIRKAARYRLPDKSKLGKVVPLIPVKPSDGWLLDRWRKDSLPLAKAAPYKKYKGDRRMASWVFDREIAQATERFYSRARGKKDQYIGFTQNGQVVKPAGGHANFRVPFLPLADGVSFRLKAFFADTSKQRAVTNHAISPLQIDRICGPVLKVDDTTFRINFYRMGLNNPKRSGDIWLLAWNRGDKTYKSAVQQLNMRIPVENKEGVAQQILFPPLPDYKKGSPSLILNATSSAGAPVYYYIKEGPAIIRGNELVFTPVPPRSRYPIKVTVVAWQYGRMGEPKLQSAKPVQRTFYLTQ